MNMGVKKAPQTWITCLKLTEREERENERERERVSIYTVA